MIACRSARLLLPWILLSLLVRTGAADEAGWRERVDLAETLVGKAEALHAAGNHAEATALCRRANGLLNEAERESPGRERTPLLAVRALVCLGDREAAHDALAVYRQRTPLGAKDAAYLQGRALVAMRLEGRPDVAVRALEEMMRGSARAVGPAVRELYYLALMGEAAHWRDRADCERALPLLHKAVDVALEMEDPGRARLAWSRAGVALSFCQRFREAEAIYRRLAAEEPDNPLWQFNLGLIMANQSRLEEAIPAYERTLELLEEQTIDDAMRARYQQAWLRLGNCHRLLAGRSMPPAERAAHVEAARAALEYYIEENPRDARGPFWYGRLLYDELDLPHEALAQFQKAYELDPICDAALRRMIQIAFRHGPRPTGDAERDARARADWSERLRAWEKDLEQNEAERERARKQREARSPEKTDGCN